MNVWQNENLVWLVLLLKFRLHGISIWIGWISSLANWFLMLSSWLAAKGSCFRIALRSIGQ
jgi:hypothetical protein